MSRRFLLGRYCASTILAGLAFVGLVGLATPAAIAAQVLYVGNDNTPGSVLQFTLPLTASSTSNFAIASNNVLSVALDANGDLAVGDNAGHLQFFTPPLSGASTPAATFNNGAASQQRSNRLHEHGRFLVATVSNRVNRFNAPFSNASTPAAFVTNAALVSAIGTALDTAQNLYISNAGVGTAITCASGAGSCSNLLVTHPPIPERQSSRQSSRLPRIASSR